MIIDAHQHFWQFDPIRDSWISEETMKVLRRDYLPQDVLPILNAQHVSGCIAVQADQSEQETVFLLDLAERYTRIKAVVGWTDLCSSVVEERLSHYKNTFPILRGFRHIVQSEPDPNFVLRPDFLHGLQSLAEFGFTYDLLLFPHQLPAAIDMLKETGDLPIVLDHMAKPRIRTGELKPWKRDMLKLAQHPALYCKVSGLITEADWTTWSSLDLYPYLDVVFEAFEPNRLMFGSDWPVCLLAGSYAQVMDVLEGYLASRGMGHVHGIWGDNAIQFYGIAEKDCGG